MGDGQAEFDAWAEETMAAVRAEQNAGYLKVIEEATGPLERHQFVLKTAIRTGYATIHDMEHELILVEDRLKFCNRAIRTGQVPAGVDIEGYAAYGSSNEANSALMEKEDHDGHTGNDGRGVRTVSPRRARR